MKNGYIDNSSGLLDGELDLLNKYTRRALSSEEVYVFSVILCDNEIDRDFERFTIDSLNKLADLYVGKTGVFDHSMKGRDQCARIISCMVEQVGGKKTASGEDYYRLQARAYMPRTAKNEDLILEIDAGIKKEVSVGCSVAAKSCSICGTMPFDGCNHKKGRFYKKDGKKSLCHAIMSDPNDAYEWSFVAVPAQREAGIIKAFCDIGKETNLVDDVIKSLSFGEDLELSALEAKGLACEISRLQKAAELSKEFFGEQKRRVLKLCAAKTDGLQNQLLTAAIEGMHEEEFYSFYCDIEKSLDNIEPQLKMQPAKSSSKNANNSFII